jgi:hypothetical protein
MLLKLPEYRCGALEAVGQQTALIQVLKLVEPQAGQAHILLAICQLRAAIFCDLLLVKAVYTATIHLHSQALQHLDALMVAS